MDLVRILGELYAERERLVRIIGALEALQNKKPEAPAPKRRGRKFMDSAARKAVSARMKRYWASRRAAEGRSESTPEDPPSTSARAAS